MVVFPHAHNGKVNPSTGVPLTFINTASGSASITSINTGNVGPNYNSLLAGFGTPSIESTTGRYLSYRVVQLGIKIIPTAA